VRGETKRHNWAKVFLLSGNLVIWLAADADIADAALQQLKEIHP